MRAMAAILVAQNEPLVVDEVELPTELAAGQVRVRVRHSGVCGSQLGEIAGVKGQDRWLPHLLGHEGGAEVLEVGPGVRHVAVGGAVVMHWRPGRGIDAVPASYRWRGRVLNSGCVTTFNTHAVVSENRLTPVPDGLPLDLAALFGCPVPTGMGVVENDAAVKPGEAVVVWGAGGVGLSVVQAAALCGAWPIVAVDLHANRLTLAERLGATHAIDANGLGAAEVASRVTALLGGPAEVVVDNTGRPDIIAAAYELCGSEGRCVLVGVPRHDADTTLHTLPLHFGRVLTGSHGGDADPPVDLPRYGKLYAAGKLDLASLVTHRYPLERINDALDDLRSGAMAGRCLIDL